MKVALVRVGIDSGSGGIQGPIFRDNSFEYIPIPDNFGVDERTYGNTRGRHNQHLIDYFPESRKKKFEQQSIHFDPEFETFTYGDPTRPKAGLRKLELGDLLIFYGGFQGWDFPSEPALHLFGYFEVILAGIASELGDVVAREHFHANFHVRHQFVYMRQRDRLVLVKGGPGSRLLKKAVQISTVGRTRDGKPLKILSPAMQRIFGDFDGKLSMQRSPTRWVKQDFIQKAATYVRSLQCLF